MTKNFSAGARKSPWLRSKLFWITSAFWLLTLIIALVSDGFGAWLVLFALFLILTAIYSLILGRRSWLGLPHRKGAVGAVGVGIAALIGGAMMVPAVAEGQATIAPLAADTGVATMATTPSATPSPSPTPSPTPQYVLLDECFDQGKIVSERADTYVCTLDDNEVLVWMTESDSKNLVSQRAETQRVADEKVAAAKIAAEQKAADVAAAEQAAADKAAADKAAADNAAAKQAAADQAAADQAAAEEAARVAAEQQAKQEAPAVQAPAEAYYPNCTAVKAAGAAPIYVGQPGYRSGLDRDGDGVACEK